MDKQFMHDMHGPDFKPGNGPEGIHGIFGYGFDPNNCGPLPPPIQPLGFIPGLNPQEQLRYMGGKVDECIRRWNDIQMECYKALRDTVGAAVSNDVYYEPNSVRFEQGYSQTDGAPYTIVTVKPCDMAGRRILVQLVPAYNNTTNSGVEQSIEDVSLLTNAQVIVSAVNTPLWNGTAMINGAPIATIEPLEGTKIVGIRHNGTMGIFDADTSVEVLRQNGVVNAMTAMSVLVSEGNTTSEAKADTTKAAFTAIGWKGATNEIIFFGCGNYDSPGCSPSAIADILASSGVTNAVITSREHGGMEFMGRLPYAPQNWNMPKNSMYWMVTKRPFEGWRNRWTAEIADLVQNVGRNSNDIMYAANQAIRAENAVEELEQKLDDLEADIRAELYEIKTSVNDEMERAEAVENAIRSDLEAEINRAEAAEQVLSDKIDAEVKRATEAEAAETERATKAEENLGLDIARETTRATEAENVLQSKINQEEQRAREKENNLQIQITNIEGSIPERVQEALESGEVHLPIATEEAAGVVKIGNGIQVTADGTISVDVEKIDVATKDKAGIVKPGDGINVTEDGTISVETPEYNLPVASEDTLGGIKVGTGLQVSEDGTLSTTGEGYNLPIASQTVLGGIKVGQNLTISPDGTLNASGGETQGVTEEQVKNLIQEQATKDEGAYLKIAGGKMTGALHVQEPADDDEPIQKKELDSLEARVETMEDTLDGLDQNVVVKTGQTTQTVEGALNAGGVSLNQGSVTLKAGQPVQEVNGNKVVLGQNGAAVQFLSSAGVKRANVKIANGAEDDDAVTLEQLNVVSEAATLAQQTATQAQDAAATAQAAAEAADAKADQAQSTANAANTAAQNAQSTASAAQATANSAATQAGGKIGLTYKGYVQTSFRKAEYPNVKAIVVYVSGAVSGMSGLIPLAIYGENRSIYFPIEDNTNMGVIKCTMSNDGTTVRVYTNYYQLTVSNRTNVSGTVTMYLYE